MLCSDETIVTSVVSIATSCSACMLFETNDDSLENEDNKKILVTLTVREEVSANPT